MSTSLSRDEVKMASCGLGGFYSIACVLDIYF